MRIAYLVGGACTTSWVRRLARLVQAAGHRVVVIGGGAGGDPPDQEALRAVIAREAPQVLHVAGWEKLENLGEPFPVPHVVSVAGGSFACPGDLAGIWPDRARRDLACPGPSVCREVARFITDRPETWLRALGRAAAVVVPSACLARALEDAGAGPVEVVRHGCVRGARRAAELGPSARPLTVGYPSPPEPEDEAIVLREAVAGLGSGRAVLKVFRPGSSLRTTDPRLAGACGTLDPDPDRVIPDVDVIVLPGPVRSSDAWLALNALASGVPVLVSDRGPLSEALRDGPPDFRFRSGDMDHLREVLRRLVDDPTALEGLRIRIAELCLPTVEQEACQYEAVYHRVGGGGAPGTGRRQAASALPGTAGDASPAAAGRSANSEEEVRVLRQQVAIRDLALRRLQNRLGGVEPLVAELGRLREELTRIRASPLWVLLERPKRLWRRVFPAGTRRARWAEALPRRLLAWLT
jgi:glycosyltransferase involved in cell wall biosynthesis